MLTLIETISLAGDRRKQNDDACGFVGACAWVIDGATDLHDKPLTGEASDASWLARVANRHFYQGTHGDLEVIVADASGAARDAFREWVGPQSYERWQSPIASLLMLEEAHGGVEGLDLGDCRIFAIDADGNVRVTGGPEGARDAEAAAAAKQTDSDKPLLQRTKTLELLRQSRASLNKPGAQWTFGLDPACANHARTWALDLVRPAHLLLMTDGFAALTDQYGAYDAGGLVRAALDKGLHELGRELRGIETADASGAQHPRFKPSDDATAVLLRLT